jgi:hypothetical protein
MALGSLEVELLSAILEYVDDESPNTTKSASLVNKHLHATAQRIRFRRQTLDLSKLGKARSHLSVLLAEPDALRCIRHLTIVGNAYSTSLELPELQSTYESLARLIRDLASLRGIVWRYAGPIPLDILDAIHQCQPRAALKVYNWCRETSGADHTDPAELALAHSPALTCLQASIWNSGSSGHPDLREAACKRIIANAPNLRYASITTGRSGCVVIMPSAAEEVELAEQEEQFYTHKQPSTSLKILTLDGYGLSKGVIDQWGRFLSFSRLESLKCSRGFVPDKSYFELAPTLLTSLKHVSLNFSYSKDADIAAAADNYLATCSPLETLSLWSWMNVISLQSILKHGPTLKTLQLHERESTHVDVPRSVLTSTDVADIRRACPILRDFTMDIDREALDWEQEVNNQVIYAELALFALDKLQLYFNLGIAAQISGSTSALNDADMSPDSEFYESDSGSPLTEGGEHHRSLSAREKAMLPLRTAEDTVNQAKSIWGTIFKHRRTGERALDIKIGEWERKMGLGYPAHWVLWEQRNRSFLKLRPNERDDMLDEVVLTCQGGLQDRLDNLR